MARSLIGPDTPAFYRRTAHDIDRGQTDRPKRPGALARFTSTGLPPAASFPGSIAFNTTLNVPVMSDGSFWYPISVGAHL